MKNIEKYLLTFLLVFFSANLLAEDKDLHIIKSYEPLLATINLVDVEIEEKYINYDFSNVWESGLRYEYFGFIGKNYQRIRVKLFSVTKDIKEQYRYYVSGKTAIDGDIEPFQGVFQITHIKRFKDMHWGCDDEYKDSGIKAQGILIGTYTLFQKRNGKEVGYFEGIYSALWYIDKNNNLKFDDIEDFADSYRNNQFIGVWKSNDGSVIMKSNWGDNRIPEDGDLDIGAGYFYPNPKYAKYGWQSYIEAEKTRNYDLHKFNWNP